MPCSFGLSPPHAKDIAKFEGNQRRVTKMIPSLRNKRHEERLSHLNLFSLEKEKKKLRGKLMECFKVLYGFTNVYPTNLFEMDDSTRTRSNGAKVKCRQVHSDCTKFFTNAVRDWNRLPPSLVQCNSIASFKNNLDRCLLHLNVH